MDLFKKAGALFEWSAMGFKAKHTLKQQLHPGKERCNKLKNKIVDKR